PPGGRRPPAPRGPAARGPGGEPAQAARAARGGGTPRESRFAAAAMPWAARRDLLSLLMVARCPCWRALPEACAAQGGAAQCPDAGSAREEPAGSKSPRSPPLEEV
ncbi:unnamed protein product, partial [Prorocentrum cordatum]